MTEADIAREIAKLDIEQAVLAQNPSDEVCHIGRRANEAFEQKAISAHVTGYGEHVLLRIGPVGIVAELPIDLARELARVLGDTIEKACAWNEAHGGWRIPQV